MDALYTQIEYLKKRINDVYKMQAKSTENASMDFSEKYFALRSSLGDIRLQFVDMEREYQSNKSSILFCAEKVKSLRKQCEHGETHILKSIPEKMKLEERYCTIARPPYGSTADMVQWLYGYVAYLHGMAWAMKEMEWLSPMLTLLRYDLESLEDKRIDYQGLESLWTEVFETRDKIGKWQVEFLALVEEEKNSDKTQVEGCGSSSSSGVVGSGGGGEGGKDIDVENKAL